jgi:hypothetical protein
MSSKSRIILLLLTMVLTIVLSVYISFAWFNMIETTDPILINTGSLRVDSEFLYGVDNDYDGVVDNGEYLEVNEGGITFTNVIPGQKYPYRIFIRNLGTIPGQLSISINHLEGSSEMLNGFKIWFNDPVDGWQGISLANAIVDHDEILTLPLLENNVIISENGASGDYYYFDFVIEVTEDISSNGGELIIRNFLITLMQIPQNND